MYHGDTNERQVTDVPDAKGLAKDLEAAGADPVHCHSCVVPNIVFHLIYVCSLHHLRLYCILWLDFRDAVYFHTNVRLSAITYSDLYCIIMADTSSPVPPGPSNTSSNASSSPSSTSSPTPPAPSSTAGTVVLM